MTFKCPRRAESHFGSSPAFLRDDDYDPSDDSCQYCGSLNPDTFMARLEAGDVLLGSTDKNYKVYVENHGGEQFKQSFRDCPRDKEMTGAVGNKYFISNCDKGPVECAHWVTREMQQTKFYFQHLSEQQQNRFIELVNTKKVRFSGDYGFYVLPFFCTKVTV
jgi:ferredoxin